MKKINKKMLLALILLLVIVTSVAGVYAEKIIASSTVSYNNQNTGLNSTDVQGVIDELYTKYAKYTQCLNNSSDNFACYLMFLKESDKVITDDGTTDHNMRYTGISPNNYVTFEGEEWRVIGVFNNIDNGTGKREARVKIIRVDSIGKRKWNTEGVNVWASASLNTELQLLYTSNVLIENAIWYLGDNGGTSLNALATYEREKSGRSVAKNNESTWNGRVGLMYISDYGFGSSSCKGGSKTLGQYNDSDCTSTNWLYLGSSSEWLLPPTSFNTASARYVSASGNVSGNNGVVNSYAVRPVVYLKTNVICKNCFESTAGTKENPFQIG